MQLVLAGSASGSLGSPTTFGAAHGRQNPKSEKSVPVQATQVCRSVSGPCPGSQPVHRGSQPDGMKRSGADASTPHSMMISTVGQSTPTNPSAHSTLTRASTVVASGDPTTYPSSAHSASVHAVQECCTQPVGCEKAPLCVGQLTTASPS